jgi:aminocarboxymuconate-semialdehyde decarboxylase
MLQYLIDIAGSNRVCLGSDYPFPLGEHVPGSLIESMSLDATTTANLLHHSALEWLNLKADKF